MPPWAWDRRIGDFMDTSLLAGNYPKSGLASTGEGAHAVLDCADGKLHSGDVLALRLKGRLHLLKHLDYGLRCMFGAIAANAAARWRELWTTRLCADR
jgi:hypothetical protein